MSWRKAAELISERAARLRRDADRLRIDDEQRREMQRRLQYDPVALDWCLTRTAQELQLTAEECIKQAQEEVTRLERGPRRG